MKVYIVEEVTNEEYGCTDVKKVFSNRKDAEKYVEKNQYTWRCWWTKKDEKALYINEWEVEE